MLACSSFTVVAKISFFGLSNLVGRGIYSKLILICVSVAEVIVEAFQNPRIPRLGLQQAVSLQIVFAWILTAV